MLKMGKFTDIRDIDKEQIITAQHFGKSISVNVKPVGVCMIMLRESMASKGW